MRKLRLKSASGATSGTNWRFQDRGNVAEFCYIPRVWYISRFRGGDMQGDRGERWRKLCEQAAVEQDPVRLLELTDEIVRLLDEKSERLQRSVTAGAGNVEQR